MKNILKKNTQSISQKIDIYKDEILSKNYKNFELFSFWGMVLTGMIAMLALIFWGRVDYTLEYCHLFIHFVLCNIYLYFFLRKNIRFTLLSFYFALAPIFLIGIVMGSFLDSENNAVTIIILLCTLFMFITDKPRHIISYSLCVMFVFLICSYLCKRREVFFVDASSIVVYLSIGLGVNILTLRDRVTSVENYVLTLRRAECDTLNRRAGDSIVKKMLNEGQKGAFIILDIDNFKQINDSYGHMVGDEVICAVTQQLKLVFNNNDIIWRLGGDEFAVFSFNLLDINICKKCFTQLQTGLSNIKTSYSVPLNIKISIGCSLCDTQNREFDFIYKICDEALYQAKRLGKNRYVIHNT